MSLDALWERLEALVTQHIAHEPHLRDPAHDLGHIRRVARAAKHIAEAEGADVEVCIAAAWLHDLVFLPKNHPDSATTAERTAALIPGAAAHVGLGDRAEVIRTAVAEHSFSGGRAPTTLESAVLQDADRLDAIGAIGIARCFATGGSFGGALWHPADPFARSGRALDDKAFSLDHFDRKLLKLGPAMNTAAGRALAMAREETMAAFLAALRTELALA
jgi:uncharacterized protein